MENNNKNRQEQIELYLLGEMNQADKVAFEVQLSQDKELQTEVELNRHIIHAIRRKNEQAAFNAMQSMTEEEFKKWHDSVKPTKIEKRFTISIIRYSVAAAAVALLLLYIGTLHEYSANELYSQYYISQSYESYPSRGEDGLTIEDRMKLQQAKSLYERKEYAQALAIYNRFFIDKDWQSQPEEIIFHTAICLFETGDSKSAIEKLTYLASSDKSDYQEEALWNLAFAYLKNNQRKKAKESLERLIAKDGDYVLKAKELRSKLNKRKWF